MILPVELVACGGEMYGNPLMSGDILDREELKEDLKEGSWPAEDPWVTKLSQASRLACRGGAYLL